MKNKLVIFSGFALSLAPVVALAVGTGGTGTLTCAEATITTIGGILCKIQQILNSVLPVLIALGVVYFVWGVVAYVVGSEEEAKKKGRDKIIYGIIGLAVILALWGLVNILPTTFGLNNSSTIVLPVVN